MIKSTTIILHTMMRKQSITHSSIIPKGQPKNSIFQYFFSMVLQK